MKSQQQKPGDDQQPTPQSTQISDVKKVESEPSQSNRINQDDQNIMDDDSNNSNNSDDSDDNQEEPVVKDTGKKNQVVGEQAGDSGLTKTKEECAKELRADKRAKKRARKKRMEAKMKRFAETIGVEDNDGYPKFKDKERLIINMSNTKYFVIKFVAKSLYNFKLSYKQQEVEQMDNCNYDISNQNNDDWDIFWTDGGVLPERIAKMKPYQKTNHFPGMFQLSRKNHLARNLIKMQKEFEKQYKFFPKTFLLPSEFGEFKNTFANKSVSNRPVYIVKPEAGCQGKGIFLTNNHEDLNPEDHYVVQQYIKKPMLIEDLKYDIRLYVMVLSVAPLRIYLFEEGLARFSTEAYRAPSKKNMDNMYMHLTNYAINCRNKGVFVFNKGLDDADTGHKRTFTSVLEYISENYGEDKCDIMMHKIEQLIIKTICTVQPSLKHYLNIPNKAQYMCEDDDKNANKDKYGNANVNSMCFEILGFDVLIDEKLKPWLIEINHAPSFATDTPLDFKMKKDVIADAIQLLGLTWKRKKKFIKSHRSNIQKRMLQKKITVVQSSENKFQSALKSTTKKNVLNSPMVQSPQGKQQTNGKNDIPETPIKKKDDSESDEENESGDDEDKYVNKYRCIYPSERNNEEEYDKYMAHAQKLYEQFTGSYSKKNREAKEKAQAEKEQSEAKEKQQQRLQQQKSLFNSPQKQNRQQQQADMRNDVSNTKSNYEVLNKGVLGGLSQQQSQQNLQSQVLGNKNNFNFGGYQQTSPAGHEKGRSSGLTLNSQSIGEQILHNTPGQQVKADFGSLDPNGVNPYSFGASHHAKQFPQPFKMMQQLHQMQQQSPQQQFQYASAPYSNSPFVQQQQQLMLQQNAAMMGQPHQMSNQNTVSNQLNQLVPNMAANPPKYTQVLNHTGSNVAQIKLTVEQIKALQSLRQLQMQETKKQNPQFHYSQKVTQVANQMQNAVVLTESQLRQLQAMSSTPGGTSHSEILKVLMSTQKTEKKPEVGPTPGSNYGTETIKKEDDKIKRPFFRQSMNGLNLNTAKNDTDAIGNDVFNNYKGEPKTANSVVAKHSITSTGLKSQNYKVSGLEDPKGQMVYPPHSVQRAKGLEKSDMRKQSALSSTTAAYNHIVTEQKENGIMNSKEQRGPTRGGTTTTSSSRTGLRPQPAVESQQSAATQNYHTRQQQRRLKSINQSGQQEYGTNVYHQLGGHFGTQQAKQIKLMNSAQPFKKTQMDDHNEIIRQQYAQNSITVRRTQSRGGTSQTTANPTTLAHQLITSSPIPRQQFNPTLNYQYNSSHSKQQLPLNKLQELCNEASGWQSLSSKPKINNHGSANPQQQRYQDKVNDYLQQSNLLKQQINQKLKAGQLKN